MGRRVAVMLRKVNSRRETWKGTKNYEKKINEKSINKKIKTKSHCGLGACPIDKNVNSAKSSSWEAQAFAIQKQKRGIEYGTA
jgi:hypothetical protein